MKRAALALCLLAPTFCGLAQKAPVRGDTRANDLTAMELLRVVVDLVEKRGLCLKIEDIRIEPIPADFTPYSDMNRELWTAVGCNREYPVWVAWTPPPHEGATILASPYTGAPNLQTNGWSGRDR